MTTVTKFGALTMITQACKVSIFGCRKETEISKLAYLYSMAKNIFKHLVIVFYCIDSKTVLVACEDS